MSGATWGSVLVFGEAQTVRNALTKMMSDRVGWEDFITSVQQDGMNFRVFYSIPWNVECAPMNELRSTEGLYFFILEQSEQEEMQVELCKGAVVVSSLSYQTGFPEELGPSEEPLHYTEEN